VAFIEDAEMEEERQDIDAERCRLMERRMMIKSLDG
jgi:hypothetical protein